LPDVWEVSTVASHVLGVTADEPLWAEYNAGFVCDTETVTKYLRGREGPA